MAFVARKPFLYEGHQYVPGDIVDGFPDRFDKSMRFLSTGYVEERVVAEKATAPRKKSQPKVEVEAAVEDYVKEG